MSNQQLRNPVWIGFDGEPVAGRTPTRVFVYGPKMTSQQQGELVRHYNKFCQDNSLALGQYQLRERYMPDGTRFRMMSVNGVDTVYVWTSFSESVDHPIFTGFVLVPFVRDMGAPFDTPNHQVWGAPFNEANDFYGVMRAEMHDAWFPPQELSTDLERILTPTLNAQDEWEWQHYKYPAFDTVYRTPGLKAGNIDWVGPPIKGLSDHPVVTFFGPESRCLPYYEYAVMDSAVNDTGASANMDSFFSSQIFFRGQVLATLPANVQAAAIRVFERKLWLVAVGFDVSSQFRVYSPTGLKYVDVVWVYQKAYIKQLRLDPGLPNKPDRGASDAGIYNPETKPFGWKVIGGHQYVAQNHDSNFNGLGDDQITLPDDTVYLRSIHAHRQPWHAMFFNQSGTECVAAIKASEDLNLNIAATFDLVKWSLTNEGYDSVATYAVVESNTSAVAADYVNDSLVVATASMPTEEDLFITIGGSVYAAGNVLHVDPRNDLVVWVGGVGHNGAVTEMPELPVGFFDSSFEERLFRTPNTRLPRTNVAVYKGFAIVSVEYAYSSTDITSTYFSVPGADLREYIGAENLPSQYGFVEVRII